ncbi:Competence protein ComM [Corynebacterium faecale]|uniref:YifB family Mg chelatase-like AAA ATPase n=1 Tax=Corynebacterium faecale TaxID=1758466 RepID=UPI0025B35057|nr:YifB family Mg chelatase-like AAA ATPase [Corynebacterium faecale]WJY92568.1 Competence protein ComM [Corynebacterium faecale]
MALGRSLTTAPSGVTAMVVTVEANVGPGLPGTFVVGLADASITESRDRIRTAVANSSLAWPKTKVIISLSPASVRKSGSHLDLAMAVAVLAAQSKDRDFQRNAAATMFLGEVALDGTLVPVTGILPALLAARDTGVDTVVIPAGNHAEAGLMDQPRVYLADNLRDIVGWLDGLVDLDQAPRRLELPSESHPDMRDVVGQPEARFAAEVAAAGGHHMMMLGPPGSGKSMIAQRLPGLLPPLDEQQRIEATVVHSVAGRTFDGPVLQAPFVAPHHSVSRAALLGGGSGNPLPGAVSLAHHGVLFLDEVSEIPASILDTLRTPLECGTVRIVRSRQDITFPASFQLVMAANLCRCGAEQPTDCTCTGSARANYLNNLSGPLRDRLDLMVQTHARGAVLSNTGEEATAPIAERVREARHRQAVRWSRAGLRDTVNATVDPHRLRREFPADEGAMAYLGVFLADGAVSQRGVDRALKLSWTLCDLEGGDRPNLDHVARALQLRGTTSLEVVA